MASKKAPQQEMAQVEAATILRNHTAKLTCAAGIIDSSGSSSPFWFARDSSSRRDSNKSKSPESHKVVGASYSHADILKLDELGLSSSSRPRTPPSSTRSTKHVSATPPRFSSPTSKLYDRPTAPQSRSQEYFNWLADEDDSSSNNQFDFEDDEDEFGLPSVARSRSVAKRSEQKAASSRSGGGSSSQLYSPTSAALPALNEGRNSSDIAEERGAPSYPTASKPEGKILRPQYKDIIKDPANALHLIRHPTLAPHASAKDADAHSTRISRINKFKKILQASSVSHSELRDSAWSGIPGEVRSITWQILLGYLPTSAERRTTSIERKRKEYLDGVKQAFEKNGPNVYSSAGGRAKSTMSAGRPRGLDESVWHQISIDVPRTSPHIELYSYEATQRSLERILYLWAIRHPASGYVQGINDLVTPFWQVFLGTYITDPDIESGMDPGQLPKPVLDAVEADSYWCLTKLLDGIQDNYIYAQPGIVRQVGALRDLTTRIDAGLAKHLEKEGVEFMQFSFRWMNCLLMREVNVKCTIRMWDTYMAEEQGFSDFHLYVCAAFLVKWSEKLVKMDFQEVMMFLQALPTKNWNEKDVELLLSEAFIWQSLFRGSSAHLKSTTGIESTM
ncbi:MAG: GTPase-activating protein [Stictis urceolatum]|nr:GTPase-activating protein [Stictis urceolata]